MNVNKISNKKRKKRTENMRQHLSVIIKRKISSTSAVEIERLSPTENMRCYYAA